MVTTLDKALVAFLSAAIGLLGFFGISLPFLTPEVQQAIAMIAAPFLVYFVPNKPAA